MIHIWPPWKLLNFQDAPTPSSIYVQTLFTLLTLDVQFQTNPSSPNDNQSIKRKHNPRINIICYQVLPSGRLSFSAFVFSINSVILSGFPLTSFHLVEASLSAYSWLYTLCVVVRKYHKMYFIYNYSHFLYSFCNQPVLFA